MTIITILHPAIFEDTTQPGLAVKTLLQFSFGTGEISIPRPLPGIELPKRERLLGTREKILDSVVREKLKRYSYE